MASTIRFFRSEKNNDKVEYKTAKIKNLQYQEFKFYELSREDINRKGELKLHADNLTKTICTSFEAEFTNDFVIVIGDSEYHIRSIYVEIDPDDNNYFNIKPRRRTYLTIIRDM